MFQEVDESQQPQSFYNVAEGITAIEGDMGSEWIIGALAFTTIGGTLAIGVFHFGVYLKDPKNRDATKRVADDRASATTRVSAEGTNGRSLRQRLDEAPKLTDRLSNRRVGSLDMEEALFHTKWSALRGSLRLGSK